MTQSFTSFCKNISSNSLSIAALEALNIHLVARDASNTDRLDVVRSLQCLPVLGKLHLELDSDAPDENESIEEIWSDVFNAVTFPKLHTLVLVNGATTQDLLYKFLTRHRTNLRSLVLKINLVNETRSWMTLLQNIAGVFMLDEFVINVSSFGDLSTEIVTWEGNDFPWDAGDIFLRIESDVDEHICHIAKTHMITELDSD